MGKEELKPRYPGWSHSETIEHQRKKIRNIVKRSPRCSDLEDPRIRKLTEAIKKKLRRWEEEERIRRMAFGAGIRIPAEANRCRCFSRGCCLDF